MSNNRRSKFYWISAWFPVLLGVGVILLESTEMMGADHTSGPLRAFVEFFVGPISNSQWDMDHHYLRKSGHFLGYGCIGLTWLRAWWMTLPKSQFLVDTALALLGTAAIASCDEFHQTFLPNRSGSPWDVLIDCSGALSLQLILYIFLRIFLPKRLAHAA